MSIKDNPADLLIITGAMVFAIFVYNLGPMAWIIFGLLYFAALVEGFTGDGGTARDTDSRPAFCVNCGAELDVELEDPADGEEYGVDYCSSCGAPVPTGGGDEESAAESAERINCPGCGSLVAADEPECGHCGEAIQTASVASK